jgi:hypothetical protein
MRSDLFSSSSGKYANKHRIKMAIAAKCGRNFLKLIADIGLDVGSKIEKRRIYNAIIQKREIAFREISPVAI